MNASYKVKECESLKEKKRLPGWSIEKMKEKPNAAAVQDD